MDWEKVLTPEQYERNKHLARYGKKMQFWSIFLAVCGIGSIMLTVISRSVLGVEGPPHILVVIPIMIVASLAPIGFVMYIVYSRSKYSPQEVFTLCVRYYWINGQRIARPIKVYVDYFA